MNKIKNNFEDDSCFKNAIARTLFDGSCKVGWQTNNRFWESNKYEIYGGISWTEEIIEQIWYPSNDYFSQKGTLTGAYIHNNKCNEGPAEEFGKLSLPERLRVAKEAGKKMHDEFDNNAIVPTEQGMSIAWQYIEHLKGAWPFWSDKNCDTGGDCTCEGDAYDCECKDYERILKPFRNRFFIVGDQASTLPGWQEGAMMSAEHVVELIGGLKTVEDIPVGISPPNTIKVLQGRG